MTPGTKLGPYEIIALIGKGGMGEVYRARDPRLGRDVAIKVSAARFSERFEREARLIASLNHPNICTLYDVGPNYLVMEYIEGESPKGPMPLDEALRIARQIADALEAAHEKPIIHRDLKPANIKIKPDGLVKVLDFGLAKMHEPPGEDGDTVPLGLTEDGTILGTPAYMSPEQALGKKADKRSDIWAFGVVLYELLTGERPFKGKEVGDILESVVKEQPDLSRAPAEVRRLLQSCLEKDRNERLRDIGDVWRQLDETPAVPSSPRSRLAWAVAGALAVSLAVAGWALWHATRPMEQPSMQLSVDLGDDALLSQSGVAISPDGKRVAFVSKSTDGKTRLSLRALESPKAQPLDGTEGADAPFFSPDGDWIGFYAQGKIQKISIEGGAPVTLCDACASRLAAGNSATWADDGQIFFAGGKISRISSFGGTPEPVTESAPGELRQAFPHALPGGQVVLFTSVVAPNLEDASVEAISLKTGKRATLVQGGFDGRYLPGIGLVYFRQATLVVAAMDPRSLKLTGPAYPVVQGIAGGDFSRTGTLVYVPGTNPLQRGPLGFLDATGKFEQLPVQMSEIPRASPDGTRISIVRADATTSDVWIYTFAQQRLSRLTFVGGVSLDSEWAPDSKHLVFHSTSAASGPGLYWIRADGGGEPQLLLRATGIQATQGMSISPDGKRLAFSVTKPPSGGKPADDIMILPLDLSDPEHPKPGKLETFLHSSYSSNGPAFSPDGQWIAYVSTESGRSEIYVRPFPGPGGKWQISSGHGPGPAFWSRTSHELFYVDPAGHVMVVAYATNGGAFTAGQPRVWSDRRIAAFDLMPDGKRLIGSLLQDDNKPATHAMFVFNFFDELRRRAAEGK